MKRHFVPVFLVALMAVFVLTSYGQMIPREDAVWARTTTTPITLDGVLDEADWAVAESLHIYYGQSSGMPGSGWNAESGPSTDPTNATVKFLVEGDSLYVAVIARDSSVGGGLFNWFDGFIMNIDRKEEPNRPANPFEYFYGWVTEPWACDTAANEPGASPCFMGFAGGPRDSVTRLIWDAVTTVQGMSNDDAMPDQGYTVEFKFNVAERGYTVSATGGDIVPFNMSIYDGDWLHPEDLNRRAGNRAWLQGPWGNANVFNHVRVFADPAVTVSDAVPVIEPEVRIGNAANYAAPTIDGSLSEPIWRDAPSFQIKFGDVTIREGYPGTGPLRSGQFQPSVNGGQASVLDPSPATVKGFFKDDMLYMGFDVSDQVVQYVASPDRYDGFRVTLNSRDSITSADHNLFAWNIRFFVGPEGATGTDEDTPYLRDSLGAVSVALQLKGGTTVDTMGLEPDSGYTAEMSLDLTEFGYPAGRGDGVAFLGVTFYDGDSFDPFTSSYGTRTWWFREFNTGDGPAWCYMDPDFIITDVEVPAGLPEKYELLGNFPNPFNPATTIKYVLPEVTAVTLEVYNVLGQRVMNLALGVQQPGVQSAVFSGEGLSSGVYLYRLRMSAPGSNAERASFVGKMALVK